MIKLFLVQTGQDLFRANFFCLKLFCMFYFVLWEDLIVSRLILVFLTLILIVSLVHGQRFVTYKCTLVFFRLALTNVKLFRNEHEPCV